jgi:ABC-2 type transport system permease protein
MGQIVKSRRISSFLISLWKELITLSRDRGGLVVLFVLPMALVLTISLVFDYAMRTYEGSGVKVLFVDRDGGHISQYLCEKLNEDGGLSITKQDRLSDDQFARLVNDGDYQVGVVIPPGMTSGLTTRVEQEVKSTFRGRPGKPLADPRLMLSISFDPTVQGSIRTAILASMRLAIMGLELQEKHRLYERQVLQILAGSVPLASSSRTVPEQQHYIDVREQSSLVQRPTSVQQNVPAWTLFGMFFIVVPLSGSLIQERQNGMLARIRSLPASFIAVLLGKLSAYVLIGQIQFLLMLAVGIWVLPALGTAKLNVGVNPAILAFISISAAIAATSYAILVGSVARTQEQASMFGPVSVVIAAAIGGIMVPTYLMPAVMRKLAMISPLSWGLVAFQEVFVRNGTFWSVLPRVGLLLCFGAAAFLAASRLLARGTVRDL